MQNPYESGHIKNYLLLYISIVVIIILFFIASTLFFEAEQKERKEFLTQEAPSKIKAPKEKPLEKQSDEAPQKEQKFKLLQTGY